MVTKITKDQRNTKGNWRLNINCLLSSILHFGICISCPTKFCITVILFRNRMITQKSLKKAQLFTISRKTNGVAMIKIHTYEIEILYRTQGKQDRIHKHEEDKIHMKRKCIGSLVLIYHLPCALM